MQAGVDRSQRRSRGRLALIVAVATVLAACAVAGGLNLLVAGSPSDPCAPSSVGTADCGPDPSHFAYAGLALVGVALVLAVPLYLLVRGERRGRG